MHQLICSNNCYIIGMKSYKQKACVWKEEKRDVLKGGKWKGIGGTGYGGLQLKVHLFEREKATNNIDVQCNFPQISFCVQQATRL